MQSVLKLSLFIFLFANINCQAQIDPSCTQVNAQVWSKFYQAYEQSDHTLMEEIHSTKLIRVPANSGNVFGYEQAMNNYRSSFQRAKEKGEKRTIALRFFERLYSESSGSERGIYELSIKQEGKETKKYYGQFHVLLIKQNDSWKILVDYDSDENNTINEESFLRAKAIEACQ